MQKLPDNFETYDEARQRGFLALKELKDKGQRVVGIFCSYVPTELIYAAGAIPVGLCAMSCARLFGPARIIACDPLPERLELARRMGVADVLLNPTTDNVPEAVQALTLGRGADAVIEAAGGHDTFQTAWQAARANACVAVVALYEEDQVLPLPRMYGKNLIFKTGGVDAIHSDRLISLIASGKIDTRPLITHTFPLSRIMDAYSLFERHADGCVKCAIRPDDAQEG